MFGRGCSPNPHSPRMIPAAVSGSIPGPSFGPPGSGVRKRSSIQSLSAKASEPDARAAFRWVAVILVKARKLTASLGTSSSQMQQRS